jgi:hypothetical protein
MTDQWNEVGQQWLITSFPILMLDYFNGRPVLVGDICPFEVSIFLSRPMRIAGLVIRM